MLALPFMCWYYGPHSWDMVPNCSRTAWRSEHERNSRHVTQYILAGAPSRLCPGHPEIKSFVLLLNELMEHKVRQFIALAQGYLSLVDYPLCYW